MEPPTETPTMNPIVIDAALAARIKQQTGPAELVDAGGHVVAVVRPADESELYKQVPNEFTAEEIERLCSPDQKWYTTEELLAKLRSLS
jgi:hypothetical protein